MPADYEEIRAENLARYGWDTAVLELLGQLYSERAHFIFELIQNAEDAGATELEFALFADRLEVRHDGRPFTPADVRAICGVGQGAKAGDLTTIGAFGIGFKAVYAYTDNPRIYSSAERFRIEQYVRPFAIPASPGVPDGQTAFVFPFDRADVPAATAGPEIAAALRGLAAETLLFLSSIARLRVSGPLTGELLLHRSSRERAGSGLDITLTTSRDGASLSQEWSVWRRPLTALGEPGHRVELAFSVHADADARRLVRRDGSPLVVYFPTQKETFLGFLIQGPYRTTPARDNVPEQDSWNQGLVAETAGLLTSVLTGLRDEGLLSAEILQALPLDPARFAPGSMFRPLFDAAASALAAGELIPMAGGGYRAADRVRLAGQDGVRELLTPELLGELTGAEGRVWFADPEISPATTPALWHYLAAEIGIAEITPESLLASLTGDFLAARPDEWIGRLYRFLDRHPSLWREAADLAETPGPARSAPIIRLENGAQVPPFDGRGRPAAYLPGPVPTQFATVRRAVAALPGAGQFLTALGFAEPDAVAEVLDHVLPRYSGDPAVALLDPARHEADLELISRALAQASQAARARLTDQLAASAFLLGENAATGESRLLRPGDLYLRTGALDGYFAGNPDAWLAADRYGPWLPQLREMGVRDAVRLEARAGDELGYVLLADDFARHERGLAGFDPAAELDGLEFALAHPTAARSEYVWNQLLVPNRHLIAGVVERSHRLEFADSSREEMLSALGTVATQAAWLPAADGTFRRPDELGAEDLPTSFQPDEQLGRALGLGQPVIEEANRQLGLPAGFLRQLSQHPDLVARIERELTARSGPQSES